MATRHIIGTGTTYVLYELSSKYYISIKDTLDKPALFTFDDESTATEKFHSLESGLDGTPVEKI